MGRSFWCAGQSHRRAQPYKDFLNQESRSPAILAAAGPGGSCPASHICRKRDRHLMTDCTVYVLAPALERLDGFTSQWTVLDWSWAASPPLNFRLGIRSASRQVPEVGMFDL